MGVGMDLFATKKDGTEFPVEVSLGNYQNDGERNAIAFISDISIRKKVEAEIEKLNIDLEATVEQRTKDLTETLHQLEISRDVLEDVLAYQKALLDNAGVMIIATDDQGMIKLFNPQASLSLGYPDIDMIDKHSPVLFHDQHEIEQKRKELLDEYGVEIENDFAVLVEKSKRNIYEEEEYTYTRKDGTCFVASLTITTVKDSAGDITGFLSIARDISERKRAEEDLRKALEKEKELSELKSRFVSMASHEFRTPLSTVLSSAYLIEKYTSTDDQPKRSKHLQRIFSSVNMLTDILNDFLSVGKIEEGKIQVRVTQFNIQELVTAVTEEIKNNLKKDQKIIYQHEGPAEVELDGSLVKHIIMNLISNASKFSPEARSIEIKTRVDKNCVSLSVKDQGIGISKEDQKHLMERFFRATNAGNIQGTGLGLHIVSKYAELMNGAVACESELDHGTEFIITFNTKHTK
jgi:PAS domain S-box-containing protein